METHFNLDFLMPIFGMLFFFLICVTFGGLANSNNKFMHTCSKSLKVIQIVIQFRIKKKNYLEYVQTHMHLFLAPFPGPGCCGSRLNRCPFPQSHPQAPPPGVSWGLPRPADLSSVFWVCPKVAFPVGWEVPGHKS